MSSEVFTDVDKRNRVVWFYIGAIFLLLLISFIWSTGASYAG
jgi:hypothetical protein